MSDNTERSDGGSTSDVDDEMSGGGSNPLETTLPIKVEAILAGIEIDIFCIEDDVEKVTSASVAEADLKELINIRATIDNVFISSEFASLFNSSPKLRERKIEFIRKLRDIRQKLLDIVDSKKPSSQTYSNVGGPLLTLPPMDVPSFSGLVEKWATFKGLFQNLINDPRLKDNNEAKTHFLFKALSGEALSLVENLRDGTFEECWCILCAFYDDPLRRAKTHYDALFSRSSRSSSLRQRVVSFRQNVAGLKSAYNEAKLDAFEQVVIGTFLDQSIQPMRLAWEKTIADKDPKQCSLEQFFKFVERECTAIERADVNKLKGRPDGVKGRTFVQTQNKRRHCKMCSSDTHFLPKCPEFLKLTVEGRTEFVKKNELCNVCFRKSYTCKDGFRNPRKCTMRMLFCFCKGAHNRLLHNKGKFSKLKTNNKGKVPSVPLDSGVEGSKVNLFHCMLNKTIANLLPDISHSFLATVVVRLYDKYGNFLDVRALLDNASQYNFVSQDLVNKTGTSVWRSAHSVAGLADLNTHIDKCTNLVVHSCTSRFHTNSNFLVVEDIVKSTIPSEVFDVGSWNIPPNLTLADPSFNLPSEVDMLLGLDIFWKVLGNRQINLNFGLPHLRETKFGWIVAGSLRTATLDSNRFVFFLNQGKDDLMNRLEKFWLVETCENSVMPLSKEESDCENFFEQTTYRRKDGRFVVRLPFKLDPSLLGDSVSQAVKRFNYLEKRLGKNPDLKTEYTTCMSEYLTLNHMQKVNKEVALNQNYYIPHHAVMKETSTSTKLRIVFDASAKSSTSLSLNDILLNGPVVQSELFSIIIRFRTYKHAFTADIVKMYRQIKIHPDDMRFQRILWRDSPNKELVEYELNTVSFGVKTAPYLATRCLNELALKYGDNFPAARSVILKDFYVDDVLSGSDSIESALILQDQLNTLLASAGFELSKWCSNTPDLLSKIDKKHLESQFPLGTEENQMIKTLGVLWLPKEDHLKIWYKNDNASQACTKRQVLSVIASIFDPMGLIGPVTVLAKQFMQKIWQMTNEHPGDKSNKPAKLNWDELLPEELLSQWNDFTEHLQCLNEIALPRYVLTYHPCVHCELHGFADASSKAFGAVIYCRSIDELNNVRVQLLCSKSRVAPLKQLSIPRLELCAALLLAELVQKVRTSLGVNTNVKLIRLWSDSKITLSWIGSPSTKWNVFVAHRVSKIQSLTSKCVWDYVESSANPADTLSRGSLPRDLKDNSLWFLGPVWLQRTPFPWSYDQTFSPNREEREDRRANSFHYALAVTKFESELFSYVNLPDTGANSNQTYLNQGIQKLIRITAWILRFKNNILESAKVANPLKTRSLLFSEYCKARTLLIKLAQREHYSLEIKELLSKGQLRPDNKLSSLSPFLDNFGVLRVGGRLQNSDLEYSQQHPIILPPEHKLTKLVIAHKHLAHLHAAPQLLKSVIRRDYWIPRVNNLIKGIILNCHTCIRHRATTQQQMMANLPKNRVTPSKVFDNTGIDYAGPFQLIGKGGRHRVIIKAYVAIFVCFATKAIHLELVSDLTTPAFLAALTRFISRRGLPSHIHSDNGTTFVGAAAEIKRLKSFFRDNENEINNFILAKGIQWHFVPPHTPHFGGLWEAGVKSIKKHMKAIMSDRLFNFEQLTTLLAQIEACLNSRPLTPESSDPNDFNALTPGHFLIGGPITALPSASLIEIPENRLKYWQQIQRLSQLFWRRWSSEYLNTLQQRHKWRINKNELKINDLVIIKEDNLPPTRWRLGRISQFHPGSDGRNRVATLKTQTGLVKRPCVKLIYLPTNN